ncbi:NADPH:quinone oxidoreductase family protein [Microbacterium sp. NPDC058062]|uniref:NADPH:quinone oxidoreductase family protein n=1 Tax=Microbacterium sp. NPDC058062 TaxID=3346320 RepID=UPI0036DB8F56
MRNAAMWQPWISFDPDTNFDTIVLYNEFIADATFALSGGNPGEMLAMSHRMRAVRNTTHGGPRLLEVQEVSRPVRAPGEVLVEVNAAGVSYPDVLQSRGEYQYRVPLPFTIGSEFAGVVVECDVDSGFSPGDRVLGVAGSGAFADYVVTPTDRVLPLPDEVDFVTAAGMPINVLSAEFALGERGSLQTGETVLIHGAAGGLGIALIQQAKIIGADVIAVVSTPEKAELARRVGADEAISPYNFLEEVRRITHGRGVDMVLDPVGGERFTDSLRALARQGRLLVLGFTGGSIPTVRVNRLLLTNTTIVGVAWEGLMPVAGVSLPQQWERLAPHVARGAVYPVISEVVPFQHAADAVAALDERRASGKLVLAVHPDAGDSGTRIG